MRSCSGRYFSGRCEGIVRTAEVSFKRHLFDPCLVLRGPEAFYMSGTGSSTFPSTLPSGLTQLIPGSTVPSPPFAWSCVQGMHFQLWKGECAAQLRSFASMNAASMRFRVCKTILLLATKWCRLRAGFRLLPLSSPSALGGFAKWANAGCWTTPWSCKMCFTSLPAGLWARRQGLLELYVLYAQPMLTLAQSKSASPGLASAPGFPANTKVPEILQGSQRWQCRAAAESRRRRLAVTSTCAWPACTLAKTCRFDFNRPDAC